MTTMLALSLLFACLAIAAELAERKSRKWYFDRHCLRLTGLFAGAALCCAIFAFVV